MSPEKAECGFRFARYLWGPLLYKSSCNPVFKTPRLSNSTFVLILNLIGDGGVWLPFRVFPFSSIFRTLHMVQCLNPQNYQIQILFYPWCCWRWSILCVSILRNHSQCSQSQNYQIQNCILSLMSLVVIEFNSSFYVFPSSSTSRTFHVIQSSKLQNFQIQNSMLSFMSLEKVGNDFYSVSLLS